MKTRAVGATRIRDLVRHEGIGFIDALTRQAPRTFSCEVSRSSSSELHRHRRQRRQHREEFNP